MTDMEGNLKHYMEMAIKEAAKADSSVYPNPRVGCVIEKEGTLLGKGFHVRHGDAHAEVCALKDAREQLNEGLSDNLSNEDSAHSLAGATMYVTLEPCNHTGQTPPCTEAIIASGISRVVVAMRDPNPLVNGTGIAKLKENNIEVIEGVLESAARYLNAVFITNIEQKRTFVTVKVAQSIDGCFLDNNKNSQWITGKAARAHGNMLRGQVDAILVGAGTVCADNPSLTLRVTKGNNPCRIIIDPNIRTPHDAKVYTDGEADTLLICHPENLGKAQSLGTINAKNHNNKYLKIVPGEFKGKELNIHWLVEYLYKKGICHVLVEGGMKTWQAFFDAGLVDECFHYISPQYLGSKFRTYTNKQQILENALKLHNTSHTSFDEDVMIHGYLNFTI